MRPFVAALLALALLAPSVTSFAQEIAPDLPLPGGGRWYTQASGESGGRTGFSVVDDARAPFWREFQRLGGASVVGYPISKRFVYAGFETQMFQKQVFQWNAADNRLDFVNIYDVISDAGMDGELAVSRQVPPRGKFDEEGKSFDQITRDRLAMLDANQNLKRAYNNVNGDPVVLNGLPTAEIFELTNVAVLRAQRVVYQYWKEPVPWAAAGTVTVANGGDIAKEFDPLPGRVVQTSDLGGSHRTDPTSPDPGSGHHWTGSADPSSTAPGVSPTATPIGTLPNLGATPQVPVPSVGPLPNPSGTPIVPAPSTSPVVPAAPSVTPTPGSGTLPSPAGPNSGLLLTDSLLVEARPENSSPRAGSTARVAVRVTDQRGRPVPGALVMIFVHYPLKSDDTIYAVDGIFVSTTPTNADGSVVVEIRIDPLAPAGLGISIEVSAIYPPTGGQVLVPMSVG